MRMLVLCLLLLAAPAAAQEKVFKLYGGANAIWFDGPNGLPSDFELGAAGRASLSPHLSLVGSGWYGFSESYLRGTVGARITATDVENKDFSIGIGPEYQLSSEPKPRPEEWCAVVSLGWRPWPETQPNLVVGGQGIYGFESNQASAVLALRYFLKEF